MDSDCSHEIKWHLLLGRKTITNLDSILKSRDIILPTKVHIVKAMVFPVVTYGCENWTIRKAEQWRTDAFKLWCWRRLLRVPWTARRSNQSVLKEINPEYLLEKLILKLKLQYFGHLMPRAGSLEKILMLEKNEGRSRGDDSGWDGWMASLIQWTWVWAGSRSWWRTEKPGMLQSMGPQRVRHDLATEQWQQQSSCVIQFSPNVIFLVQNPLQDTPLHVVIVSPEAPLGSNSFSECPCFWWPQQIWGLPSKYLAEHPFTGISLMFFSWLDQRYEFCGKDLRSDVLASYCITVTYCRCDFLLLIQTWTFGGAWLCWVSLSFFFLFTYSLPGGLLVKRLPANAGDRGSTPGSGRSPGGRNNYTPLQYSCLENPMDGGAW